MCVYCWILSVLWFVFLCNKNVFLKTKHESIVTTIYINWFWCERRLWYLSLWERNISRRNDGLYNHTRIVQCCPFVVVHILNNYEGLSPIYGCQQHLLTLRFNKWDSQTAWRFVLATKTVPFPPVAQIKYHIEWEIFIHVFCPVVSLINKTEIAEVRLVYIRWSQHAVMAYLNLFIINQGMFLYKNKPTYKWQPPPPSLPPQTTNNNTNSTTNSTTNSIITSTSTKSTACHANVALKTCEL